MEIDKRTLRRVCEIAKMELSEEESERYLEQFDEIFQYFSIIKKMKTPSKEIVEKIESPLREDVIVEEMDTELIREQFPKKRGKICIVPRSL